MFLFALYVNDLPNAVNNVQVDMYADDTTLHTSCDNYEDLTNCLQSSIDKLIRWLDDNRLVLNVEKTKIMIIGSHKKASNSDERNDKVKVFVNSKEIDIVNSARVLGIEIDSHLNFHNHVDKIASKVSSKIGFLRRLKPAIPRKQLSLMFHAIINPHFDYCSPVWSGASKTSTDKLFKLQKRGLRMVCDARWDAPTKELFHLVKWVELPQMFLQNDCKMVFKCVHNLNPNYICKCFNEFNNSRYNTRQSTNKTLRLPHCQSSLYKKSFVFRGSLIWNTLDQELTCCKSFSLFKRKLKETPLSLPV